jgi:hypothetical protein
MITPEFIDIGNYGNFYYNAYVLSSYCFYQGFVRYRLCGKAGLHEPVK